MNFGPLASSRILRGNYSKCMYARLLLDFVIVDEASVLEEKLTF
jgi:hypothetical protein